MEYESLNDLLKDRGLIAEEGKRVEFKRAKNGLSQNFWLSVNAFLNSTGGYILLGFEDDTKESVPDLDIDRLQKDISSGISQRLEPALAPDIEVLNVKGNNIIMVSVRSAEIHNKPVYLVVKGGDRLAYKRIGSSNLQMVKEDFERLAIERSGKSPDSLPLRNYSLDHLDLDVIQRYRNRLRAFPSAQKLLERDDLGLLRGLNALHFEAEDNSWHLTNAALLLFGKADIIMANFPSLEVQILNFESSPTIENRGKKDSILGMALIDFISEVEKHLKNLVPYGNIRVTSGKISRDSDNVYIALREALVNAIVHQDFLANRYIQIRIYGDKLEIENAGYSKKPTSDFSEPGSIPRNPIIARAFEMAGFVEKQGLGGTTMMKAMTTAGFAEPKFNSSYDKNSFTVSFFWHHFMSEDDLSWVSHLKDIKKEEEKIALVATRQQGSINNEALRDKLGCDTLGASKILRALTRKGYLEKSGTNKSATYYLTPKANIETTISSTHVIEAAIAAPTLTPTMPKKMAGDNTTQVQPNLSDVGQPSLYDFNFGDSSKETTKSYSQNSSNFESKTLDVDTDISSKVLDDPAEHTSKTLDIDTGTTSKTLDDPIDPSVSRTTRRIQTETKILDLAIDFISLIELAAALKLTPEAVRTSYILPMLSDKRLEMKYPTQPKKRGQAYRRKQP